MTSKSSFLGSSLIVGLLVVASTGCEPAGPPTGTLTGMVTVNGQPVTNAMVTIFSPAIGRGTNCKLDETGGYRTEKPLPLAEYAVYIEKLPPGPGEIAVPGPPPGVAAEYSASHTTPFKVAVVEGETKFDVAIP